MAHSRCLRVTSGAFSFEACIAAKLHGKGQVSAPTKQSLTYLIRFCRSAPEKPGVPRARILGSTSNSGFSRIGMMKIEDSLTVADSHILHVMLQYLDTPTYVRKRNRDDSVEPSRSYKCSRYPCHKLYKILQSSIAYRSRLCGKLVAAITMTPTLCWKPSISTRS